MLTTVLAMTESIKKPAAVPELLVTVSDVDLQRASLEQRITGAAKILLVAKHGNVAFRDLDAQVAKDFIGKFIFLVMTF